MLLVSELRSLVLVALGFVGVACSPHPHESIVFAPLVDQDYPARSEPAELSTDKPEQLRARGYVEIGELLVIRVTSICYETCKKVEHELDCTATLLRKAADHGGELVTLELDNSESSRKITKAGDCIESYTQTNHQVFFVPPEPGSGLSGRFENVTETETICTEFETIHGTESFQQSAGTVWLELE